MNRFGAAVLAAALVAVAAPASLAVPNKEFKLSKVGFKLESAVARDWAGYSIAVGDFDGDGVTDLAVGAPCDDTAAPGSGAIHVLYGPVKPGDSLAAADAVLVGIAGDAIGDSLAALDIDGDGVDALVVGAPGPVVGLGPLVEDCFLLGLPAPLNPGANKAGEVFLLRGGERLSGVVDIRVAAETIISGYAPADFAGWGVAGADLNGDAKDELIATAIGMAAFTGTAFLFPGGDLPASASALDAHAHFLGESPGGWFGNKVLGGDVNGDGIDDLLVNAQEGVTYVFLGGELPSGVISASAADIVFEGEGGDMAGQGLAVGDLNGDGIADLVVGAPEAGMTYVFYGPIDRRGRVPVADADVRVIGAADAGAGYAVAVADLDGDQNGDLIVGADLDGTGGHRAGVVYRLVGKLAGDIDPTATGFRYIGEPGDHAGGALAVGDVTGDGYDDLIVGAPALGVALPVLGEPIVKPGGVYIVPGG